jgi:hypothetical protein
VPMLDTAPRWCVNLRSRKRRNNVKHALTTLLLYRVRRLACHSACASISAMLVVDVYRHVRARRARRYSAHHVVDDPLPFCLQTSAHVPSHTWTGADVSRVFRS